MAGQPASGGWEWVAPRCRQSLPWSHNSVPMPAFEADDFEIPSIDTAKGLTESHEYGFRLAFLKIDVYSSILGSMKSCVPECCSIYELFQYRLLR